MNANDSLRHYNCTDNYHAYYLGYVFTDGIKALCDQYECYWLLDIIVSYQPELKGEEFQVWKLKKLEDDSAIVTCEDGNDRVLKRQVIDYTDFKATTATVWVEFNTILLPSEH